MAAVRGPSANPKAKAFDPISFIDNSIIKELEAGGFIRDLYAQ
jgi:hypothetical protein